MQTRTDAVKMVAAVLLNPDRIDRFIRESGIGVYVTDAERYLPNDVRGDVCIRIPRLDGISGKVALLMADELLRKFEERVGHAVTETMDLVSPLTPEQLEALKAVAEKMKSNLSSAEDAMRRVRDVLQSAPSGYFPFEYMRKELASAQVRIEVSLTTMNQTIRERFPEALELPT